MTVRTRKVEIRVRILGERSGKIRWKIYPPLVLDMGQLKGKLGILAQRWVEQRGAFYTSNELEMAELIKLLAAEIVSERKNRKGECEHPEKLKGKPVGCTPEQIRECHGDVKEHPCVSKE